MSDSGPHGPLVLICQPLEVNTFRVLARNFKTWVRDSLLGIIWRPRMKICVRVSEYDESSWSYETRAAPIATSEFEIRYSLSKVTKRSDELSHSLQTIFCLSFDLP